MYVGPEYVILESLKYGTINIAAKKSHMSLVQLFIFGIQNEYDLYAKLQAMAMTIPI